jgi:hypothetical protein
MGTLTRSTGSRVREHLDEVADDLARLLPGVPSSEHARALLEDHDLTAETLHCQDLAELDDDERERIGRILVRLLPDDGETRCSLCAEPVSSRVDRDGNGRLIRTWAGVPSGWATCWDDVDSPRPHEPT